MAAADSSLLPELRRFAKQVAGFTWQYRRLDLLLRISQLVANSSLALKVVKQAVQEGHFKNSRVTLWIARAFLSQQVWFEPQCVIAALPLATAQVAIVLLGYKQHAVPCTADIACCTLAA